MHWQSGCWATRQSFEAKRVTRTSWLAAAVLLAGCGHRAPAPVASVPHYVVGAPYSQGGVWYYPRESFQGAETGLAEIVPDRGGATADGEAFDPSAMTGAHHTLQLPAVVLVTNLENGRQLRIRVNDRGPERAGRILGLPRAAGALLGVPGRGAAQVRVEVEQGPSEALRDRLEGGPKGVTAAPVAAVVAEDLPAPGHAAVGRRVAAGRNLARGEESGDREAVPDRLPATVVQGAAQPGELWVRAGRFTTARYANALKARLSGLNARVRREAAGRQAEFVVEAGPFRSVADADNALDQARADGVTDAAIVVE